MTQEEKAKAYDDALKVVKGNLDALNEIIETGAEVVNIQAIKNCFYRAFSELKENEGDSEDERIRKWLIDTIKSIPNDSIEWNVIDKSRVLDWLEKQKEQKPSINIDQLKSLMLQYFQEAANEKDDSDIEADTDKWARKILGYDFERKPAGETHNWISVKVRKPEIKYSGDNMKYSNAVIVTNGKYCTSARLVHSVWGGWYSWYDDGDNELKDITHWMPMPKVPKDIYKGE